MATIEELNEVFTNGHAPKAKKTLQRAGFVEAFKVRDLLQKHGTVSGDVYTYADGWNDARIAEEAGVAKGTVSFVRREAFGSLLNKSEPKDTNDDRLTTLEKRIAALERVLKPLMS